MPSSFHSRSSRSLLRQRNVGLLWVAGTASAVGNGAMFVALPYFTFVTTGSITATTLVTLAEYAPTIGLAQWAGVWVDRWPARRVLIVVNAALAICTLAYLAVDRWEWLAAVTFGRSCLAQFLSPATNMVIPSVAPPGRVAAVNGLIVMGGNVARLAGPGLGGVLLTAVGLRGVATLDAASFVIAAAAFAGVRMTTAPPPAGRVAGLRAWRDGVKVVVSHPVLARLVVVMGLVGFGEGFVSVLIAPWMASVAGGSSADLGLMLSLQALGGTAAGAVVIRNSQRWLCSSQLCVGALVSAVLLLLIFNYPLVAAVGPVPAIVLNAVAGFPFALYGNAQAVSVQTHSPDRARGRTASLTFGVQGLCQLIGIAAAPPTAHLVGPLAINADAIAYLAAGLLALLLHRRVAEPKSPPGWPARSDGLDD